MKGMGFYRYNKIHTSTAITVMDYGSEVKCMG